MAYRPLILHPVESISTFDEYCRWFFAVRNRHDAIESHGRWRRRLIGRRPLPILRLHLFHPILGRWIVALVRQRRRSAAVGIFSNARGRSGGALLANGRCLLRVPRCRYLIAIRRWKCCRGRRRAAGRGGRSRAGRHRLEVERLPIACHGNGAATLHPALHWRALRAKLVTGARARHLLITAGARIEVAAIANSGHRLVVIAGLIGRYRLVVGSSLISRHRLVKAALDV